MRLTPLIKSIGAYQTYTKLPDFAVRGISCNSKDVKDNFIFVAIKGNQQDGHKFIQEAIDKGARLIITQDPRPKTQDPRPKTQDPRKTSFIVVKDTRNALTKLAKEFYANPSKKVKVIGITGTNGKTTVSYLIEAVLKKAGIPCAVIGTISYRFKHKLIPARNTTPGPIELQSILAEAKKEGINYAVTEVSSHALAQGRTDGINFHSAIFTNLTQDHLDYHQSIENYFRAKSKLFRNIKPKSFAVINNDDKYGRRLRRLTAAKIVTYGINKGADIMAKDINFDIQHTRFRLVTKVQETDFKTSLIGEHNVYNVLAAVAWALKERIDLSLIKSCLQDFKLVPGRLQRIDADGRFSIFVDYAHTEDALKKVIAALRRLAKNRIIVVFGCGGERDKTKRPKMGYAVSELADYAIITNDNPRSEDPKVIINEIKKGIRKNNYIAILDRFAAIRKALTLAKQNDIVLIAGKGHENYQILKDRAIPFDDREVVKECLKSLNY